jgi:ribose 5-phosphate isomerase B
MTDVGRRIIAIGSDHAGFLLKEALEDELVSSGYTVVDVGTDSEESCDYPDFGLKVAEAVSGGEAWRGVLVCGTGAGMAMVANKVPGVRAAACSEPYTAEYCRLHNDANVLTMGARIVDLEAARKILHAFLDAEYEGTGSRHERRLGKIREVERKYMREA